MGKDLLKELEKKRQLMIQTGIEHGLQNPKTIRISKELDRLMNEIDNGYAKENEQIEKNDEYNYL
ncbi:aspartyl-phosphate phosphatase Spo0E family protein [Lysinibacillus sp. SGAir0095]|uniref:aspartyl-phosphate phosphatase Spo0E family protein n=1 Tax=Lysinibacillus sp. SGAir0095 TaxID=2070463 RepID=UPI0010CCC072|nr:aspartyl-phosphate phosphatase Spo0E family protein [Lysinibacillus sp. SGAir0095]QCR31623.1 aspartyl-phosphate phosphatase Spo0E family protein [Lysinibacillus sp. SGAir0095]